MENTSNRLRIIVIAVLVMITGSAIVLLAVGSKEPDSPLLSTGENSNDLRSFDSAEAQGVTRSTDPCNLVGRQDVEAELGVSVADPQSGYAENPLGERFCRFPSTSNSGEDLVLLSIVFNDAIDPALLNDGYNVTRMYEGRKVSPEMIQLIEDVGDDAFWGGTGTNLWNGLHILVHDIYVQVDVNSGDQAVDYQAARNLAIIALELLFGR